MALADAAQAPPPAGDDAAEPAAPPLPDVETLGPGSDFKPFLREGVPEALQRAALRKLWRSNSVLANLDGLVDYADDYTDAAVARPNLKTVFKTAMAVREAALKAAAVPAGSEPASAEGVSAAAVEAPDSTPEIEGDLVADSNDSKQLADKPHSS